MCFEGWEDGTYWKIDFSSVVEADIYEEYDLSYEDYDFDYNYEDFNYYYG